MKALLSNYHQAPRKARLVADLIRGKSITDARTVLTFLPKKSSPAFAKLLNSAVANAESKGIDVSGLFVQTVTVNKGTVLKRMRPFKQGRAGRLHHIFSHIVLELGTKGGKGTKVAVTRVSDVTEDTDTATATKIKTAKPKSAKKVAKKTTKK